MDSVLVGKIYCNKNGRMRKVELINGLVRKTVMFQEIDQDGSETGRLHFKGFKMFCKWANAEITTQTP